MQYPVLFSQLLSVACALLPHNRTRPWEVVFHQWAASVVETCLSVNILRNLSGKTTVMHLRLKLTTDTALTDLL